MISGLGLVSTSSLYGSTGPGTKTADSGTVQASGTLPATGSKTPAYFWVAFVGLLVVIRVAMDLMPEAS